MATNYVKAKFQEIYDMGTVSGRTTILGIHTPQGDRVQKLLGGFFRQFRKFKYSGCSVTMVPAAQLPADPLQVSFEAGSLTVDPRDLLNPILFHGCHGESLNEILNQYLMNSNTAGTSSVDEVRPTLEESEAGYYSALSDPSFRKFGIQSGAKVSLTPKVHPLVMTNPLVPSDAQLNYYQTVDGLKVQGSLNGSNTGQVIDMDTSAAGFTGGFRGLGNTVPLINSQGVSSMIGVSPVMFSNGLRPLGWLPTTSAPPMLKEGEITYDPTQAAAGTVAPVASSATIGATKLPKLFMGFFMLPPSYTQEMYFRLIINHYFEFKDFTTCLALNPDGPQSAYTETIPEPSPGGKAAKAEATSLEIIDGNVALTTDGVY